MYGDVQNNKSEVRTTVPLKTSREYKGQSEAVRRSVEVQPTKVEALRKQNVSKALVVRHRKGSPEWQISRTRKRMGPGSSEAYWRKTSVVKPQG
jgi:hypothetical protein